MNHRMLGSQNLEFIILKEDHNVPLILRFLLLELAIDGLRLAAVNTGLNWYSLECHGGAGAGKFSVEVGGSQ